MPITAGKGGALSHQGFLKLEVKAKPSSFPCAWHRPRLRFASGSFVIEGINWPWKRWQRGCLRWFGPVKSTALFWLPVANGRTDGPHPRRTGRRGQPEGWRALLQPPDLAAPGLGGVGKRWGGKCRRDGGASVFSPSVGCSLWAGDKRKQAPQPFSGCLKKEVSGK